MMYKYIYNFIRKLSFASTSRTGDHITWKQKSARPSPTQCLISFLCNPTPLSHNKFTQINIGIMTQPKLTKSIFHIQSPRNKNWSMYYIRIPAHEIEKNEYVFINGHNQFDTKKWIGYKKCWENIKMWHLRVGNGIYL